MAEKIAFEDTKFSKFEGHVTLTLTLDRVILHTVVHYSSTSTYIPNLIDIEETFCGQRDVRTCTYVLTYGQIFETHFIRPIQKSRPKNSNALIRELPLYS